MRGWSDEQANDEQVFGELKKRGIGTARHDAAEDGAVNLVAKAKLGEHPRGVRMAGLDQQMAEKAKISPFGHGCTSCRSNILRRVSMARGGKPPMQMS